MIIGEIIVWLGISIGIIAGFYLWRMNFDRERRNDI